MKVNVLSSLIGVTCAFAPVGLKGGASTVRLSAEAEEDKIVYSVLSEPGFSVENKGESAAALVAPINGWVPDTSKPLYGLPGSLPPTGYFDPIGFAQTGISLNDVKRYREAEVQHGRVAMLAVVGYFAGEAISGPFGMAGPANDQLQQMPLPAFILFALGIGGAEIKRAQIGWVEPDFSRLGWTKTLFTLRDSYYPGDLGFDPLGLKPTEAGKFASMQTRELQNGRLAMIGIAGIIAQELVNHKSILDTFDFYQKFYSGIDPYQ
jgi:hypothetical protein